MENFKPHGCHTSANGIVYFVEISEDGNNARLLCNNEITDWLEIEIIEDHNLNPSLSIFTANNYEIPLTTVFKIN